MLASWFWDLHPLLSKAALTAGPCSGSGSPPAELRYTLSVWSTSIGWRNYSNTSQCSTANPAITSAIWKSAFDVVQQPSLGWLSQLALGACEFAWTEPATCLDAAKTRGVEHANLTAKSFSAWRDFPDAVIDIASLCSSDKDDWPWSSKKGSFEK